MELIKIVYLLLYYLLISSLLYYLTKLFTKFYFIFFNKNLVLNNL